MRSVWRKKQSGRPTRWAFSVVQNDEERWRWVDGGEGSRDFIEKVEVERGAPEKFSSSTKGM